MEHLNICPGNYNRFARHHRRKSDCTFFFIAIGAVIGYIAALALIAR